MEKLINFDYIIEVMNLEDIVESTIKKYELNEHFKGFVMASLGEFLNVEVTDDFNIEPLAKKYMKFMSIEEIPLAALFWEKAYDERLFPSTFFEYLEQENLDINQYIEINNLDIFNEIINDSFEEYKKELINEKELNELLSKYGLQEEIGLDGTKISRNEIENIVGKLLERKNRLDNSKGKTTLYTIINENCKSDVDCIDYLKDIFGEKDYILRENTVELYKKAIKRLTIDYRTQIGKKLNYIY